LLFCNYQVGVPRIHEPEWLRMIKEVKGVVCKNKSGSVD